MLCFLDCRSGCACDQEAQPTDLADGLISSHKSTSKPSSYAKAVDSLERGRKPRNAPQSDVSPQLMEVSGDEEKTHRKIARETQAFRDYAAGGHVESDRSLVALAKQEAAEARRKQLDEDNWNALFGTLEDLVPAQKTKEATLVQFKSDGQGSNRSTWQGTFDPRRAQGAQSNTKETSLLDL